MISFKSNCFLIVLSLLIAGKAFGQEMIYLVPPVQLLPLKKMQTNAYGLIVAKKDDILNENLWKNAAYPVTADKFAKAPQNLVAEAENLRLKLLTLAAEPPQGTTGQSFITLKLHQLFDRAAFDDVYRLMQKIPEKIRSDEQNKIYADTLLIQDMQAACFLTNVGSDDVFWQQLSAVCAAFNKEEDKTFLAMNVLKEQYEDDLFTVNAVEFFLEGKPLTQTPKRITPLSAAVWKKAGKGLIELNDETQSVWFKKMFVSDETIPVEKRLNTAENLVEKGLLPSSKLRTYYQQIPFAENVDEDELSPATYRAFMLQKAAALSSLSEDNVQKQIFLKKALESAKKDRFSYAFANASKDVLETLKPDLDTLAEADTLIEAFALSGLNEKAQEWFKKSEILFPNSETTAKGWIYAELIEKNPEQHIFIPHLEKAMAFAEKNQKADDLFINKIDRLMLMFKTLEMIQSDETWHYTSFAEGSESAFIAARQKNPAIDANKPAGESVLEALNYLDGSYIGLIKALSILTTMGLKDEAAQIALQSLDIVLNPESGYE